MSVMVRTERGFTPICEFRCKWCGEDSVHWTETATHGYGTPLCEICNTLNEQLYDLRGTLRKANAILNESPLPQPGQTVRHKHAPWRGRGIVTRVFGRLAEVVWTHGFTIHHHDTDLEKIKR